MAAAAVVVGGGLAPAAVAQDGSGFTDVGDGVHSAAIEELNGMGLFERTECEEGKFCPRAPVKRWTMAVWLVRVLDDSEPPDVTESTFEDVDPAVWWAAHVERFKALKVTTGCGDGTVFCPDDTVTRAQMAVFLSRAFDLAEGPDPGFGDVSSDAWYAADVAKLAASGITKGCGDGTVFCPEEPTSRAQMATFIARALVLRGGQSSGGEDSEATQPGTPDGPRITVEPATVPKAGRYLFTITGTGFVPGSTGIYVTSCTIPGDPVTIDTPADELAAAIAKVGEAPLRHCDISDPSAVRIDADGGFVLDKRANIGVNFLWGAGNFDRTQAAEVPVFIVDESPGG